MKAPLQHERLNTATHGLGILLGLIGAPFLLIAASKLPHPLFFWGALIYTISLLMVFTSSTLYHWAHAASTKKALRKWDHISIYFLIAGTYTPFLFNNYIQDSSSAPFIYIMWGLALAGTLYKLFAFGKDWVSLIFYVAMGWMAVFFGKDFFADVSSDVIKWIIAGGVLYTQGVVFYAIKKIPFNHAIWHVFVMAAAGCHFVAIYLSYLK